MNDVATQPVQEKRKKRPRIGDAQRVRNRISELNSSISKKNTAESGNFAVNERDQTYIKNLTIMKESIEDYRKDAKEGKENPDTISLRLQRRLRLVLDRVEAAGYKGFVKGVKENLKQQLLTNKEEFFDSVDKAVADEIEKHNSVKNKSDIKSSDTNKKIILKPQPKEIV